MAHFMPAAIAAPFAWAFPRTLLDWWYSLLISCVERAGCTFVKFGQWASHREDFVPEELCIRLRQLRGNAKAHSLEVTRQAIRDEFGVTLEELFSEFSEQPVASGSVAQVHRAVLRATGREVAVKVRHPHVEEQLELDLEIALTFGNFLSRLPGLHWMKIPVQVEEFAGSLREQARLTVEATNLARFRKNFTHRHHIRVVFPEPIEPYVSDSVLIESWEDGESIQHYIDHPQGDTNTQLANTGYKVFMSMMIMDNFMHADAHAGNMLVRIDPETHQPVLVVIDAGLVTELTQRGRLQFLSLLKDVVRADGNHAAQMFLSLGPCPEPREFIAEMEVLFKRVCTVPGINVGRLISDCLALVRKHHLVLRCDFAEVLISMSVLEGVARALDPTLDLVRGMMPFLLEEMKQRVETLVKAPLQWTRQHLAT